MFDVLIESQKLRQAGVPYALATVVRIERPTSAKPGAKAIVTADGTLSGWVGGSCAQPTVVREALRALVDGLPRLLHLGPPDKLSGVPRNGLVEIPITCESEGTLEIYVEPYVPAPHLVLIGHLPVVETLCTLGHAMGYHTTVMGSGATLERFATADSVMPLDLSSLTLTTATYVVVASHGNYDEPALDVALRSPAQYVALVASPKRLAGVLAYLKEGGITGEQLQRLKCPAGLNIGAVTPEEIALSILTEIVQVRRKGLDSISNGTLQKALASSSFTEKTGRPTLVRFYGEDQLQPDEATCAACGMILNTTNCINSVYAEGKTWYFCCPSCKRRFEKNPGALLDKHWNNL